MKLKDILGTNMRALLEIHEEMEVVSSQCRVSFFNKLNNGVADSLGNLFEMVLLSLDNTEVMRYSKFILEFTDEKVNKIFNPTTSEESVLTSFSATIGACFFILDNIELVVEKGATDKQINDIYIILFHALINAPNNDFYDKNLVDFEKPYLNKFAFNKVMLVISNAFGTIFIKNDIDKIEEWYTKWKNTLEPNFEINALKWFYDTELRLLDDRKTIRKWG